MTSLRARLAAVFALILVAFAVHLWAVDGPLTNAMNLRVRTDANGYLIGTGGGYTAPDGPLTAFGNIRLRTDQNGYLLVAINGGSVTGTTGVFTTSVTTPLIVAPSFLGMGTTAAGAIWTIDATTLAPVSDNARNIGAVANRVATVYAQTLSLAGATMTLSGTAPTIASFAGSVPAAAVVAGSTAAAWRITVGGTAPGTTGTINLPTATTGWNCWVQDQTTPLDITRQTSSTTSSVGITSTIAWTANDILVGGCVAF